MERVSQAVYENLIAFPAELGHNKEGGKLAELHKMFYLDSCQAAQRVAVWPYACRVAI